MVDSVTWHLSGLPRVPIDLNDRSHGGLTRARLAAASAPVVPGDAVMACEPEEGVVALAHVRQVDADKGLILLEVDWASLRDDVDSAHEDAMGSIASAAGEG